MQRQLDEINGREKRQCLDNANATVDDVPSVILSDYDSDSSNLHSFRTETIEVDVHQLNSK